MPSGLARTFQGRLQARSLAEQVNRGYQTIQQRGPFLGFIPDVDPNLMDGTAFRDLQNVLARSWGEDHGEVLGLPDGFRQVDYARLPLGDNSTLPAAPLADGNPIVRIDQIARLSPTGESTEGDEASQWVLTPVVGTAGDGSTANTGFLYRLNASGQWTQIRYAASMSTGANDQRLSATINGRSTAQSMPDSCIAPFGAVARANNTGGGDDKQSGNITEPCWIFTNDVDEVMVFPSHSDNVDGTRAGNHWYEPLCDDTSSADLDGGVGLGFKAKSVETWNGRVYFLNTSEAGVRRSRRLRRTAKFTADPLTSTPGAGFYDFPEFQGQGLRIETLGDVLAVYFEDGVAFMRATGNPTSPDEPQIISTERGLLSTHSVCSIGRGVHFGIFTDGWWLLDQSGRWQEVGITQANGRPIPKWRQTFFDRIPSDQRHRLQCYYDQPYNLIYIAVPTESSADPTEIWIYDPVADRVFIENYTMTVFGTITPQAQSGVQIDALVGDIDSQVGTIDSFAAVAGFPKARAHGDPSGYVYIHRRDVEGYDPANNTGAVPTVQDPTWIMESGLRSPTGIRNFTSVDRVTIEHFDHQNANIVSVECIGTQTDGTSTANVSFTDGLDENLRRVDAFFRYTSIAPGLRISGTGTYHIRAVDIDLWIDPVEERT